MQRSTRAQIQIGETVAVILIFVILMIFGLYWMLGASTATNTQQQSIRDRTDLLETAKLVMNMPEIHCSVAAVVDTACVDKYRLMAIDRLIEEDLQTQSSRTKTLYSERFLAADRGSYSLTVTPVTHGTSSRIEVFNFTTGNVTASRQTVAIPVVIYDPITKIKQFGMAQLTHEVLP